MDSRHDFRYKSQHDNLVEIHKKALKQIKELETELKLKNEYLTQLADRIISLETKTTVQKEQ